MIAEDLKAPASQDILGMDRRITCVIFCDKHYSMPPGLFGDLCHTGKGGTATGTTGDSSGALKNSTARRPHSPNADKPETEMDARDSNNALKRKSGLKSCENCDAPGGSRGRSGGGKKRKSVSFLDDVTIYLFDQVRSWRCGPRGEKVTFS